MIPFITGDTLHFPVDYWFKLYNPL